MAGFKYFDLRETSKIRINIRGNASGMVYIRTAENQEPVAKIEVKPTKDVHGFVSELKAPGEKQALFFKYEGRGSFDFISFDLA